MTINKLPKDTLCWRVARLQARGNYGCGSRNQEAGNEAHERRKHTGIGREQHRLFEHMKDQGEQVETLWESGKTIRHLTREERQDT